MNREMQQMMSIVSQPNGLKKMMLKPSFENERGDTFSQAELVADVINIMRMDTKRIGLAVGVEIEVNQMTPEYAAELLQGVAKGENTQLIEEFDAIENKRMKVLAAITNNDTTQEWMERKAGLLYTTGGLESETVEEEVATDDVDTDFDPDAAAEMAHEAMEQMAEADGGEVAESASPTVEDDTETEPHDESDESESAEDDE